MKNGGCAWLLNSLRFTCFTSFANTKPDICCHLYSAIKLYQISLSQNLILDNYGFD